MNFLKLSPTSGLLTIQEHLSHRSLRVLTKLQLERTSSTGVIAFSVTRKSAKNDHFSPFLPIFEHFFPCKSMMHLIACLPLVLLDVLLYALSRGAIRFCPILVALRSARFLCLKTGQKRPFLSRNDCHLYRFYPIAQKRDVC